VLAVVAAVVAVAAVAVGIARRTPAERVVAAAPTDVPSGRATTAASLPVLASSAPAIEASGWINSPALAPTDLAGKVVLYDFWTFGCVNCQNTLPYVKAWYARYAADGLVVLGIHSPEFSYEAQADNVRAYVAEHGITYPVALDPDHVVWRAFDNHYWPNFYLHDRSGQRRYTHIGEGSYRETEDAIRALLGVDPSSPRATLPA
jgi:thiol-disulfide isomerase/thioredoxin